MITQPDERIERAFRTAARLSGDARGEWIDRHCRHDPLLRRELETLLLHHDAPALLDEPIDPTSLGGDPFDDVAPVSAGDRIGTYRVLEVLGTGGMGSVCRAEQERPVRRVVALKLIRPGVASSEGLARFESERQTMALLQSPHIAHIYDAGAADDGRPFLAMELVEGSSITSYCRSHGLSVDERLELFLQVCEGVQHAHQRGVIHRDLKPANILVATTDDGPPLVKIIDFGVAKMLDSRILRDHDSTVNGLILGTPDYMSPEQAGGGTTAIDTRSDVYSLGVVLYELLTGELPFVSRDERVRASPERARDHMRPAEIVKPSRVAAASERRGSALVASGRSPSLARQLRGDLDWIVLKALETDRERRYQAVSELADDVRRHRHHEPVLAGAPSARYRLAKLVRRHRGTVFATAVVAAALLASTVTSVRFYLSEREARRIAEASAADSERAAKVAEISLDFMRAFIAQGAPSKHSDGIVGAREATRRATDQMAAAFADHPVAHAKALLSLGALALEEGDLTIADTMMADAVELLRAHPEAGAIELAHGLQKLAEVRSRVDLAEAVALAQEASDVVEQALGRDHPWVAKANKDHALLLARDDRLAEAEALLRRAARILEKPSPSTADVPEGAVLEWHVVIQQSLASVSTTLGRYEAAREALARARESAAELDPSTSSAYYAAAHHELLGRVHYWSGSFPDARNELEQAVELRTRTFGPDHSQTTWAKIYLAAVLAHEGEFELADRLLDETRAAILREGVYGTAYLPTHTYMRAESRRLRGEHERAVTLYEDALDGYRALTASKPRWIARVEQRLGELALARGALAEAESWLRSALETRRASYADEQHPEIRETRRSLAALLQLDPDAPAPIASTAGTVEQEDQPFGDETTH